MDNRRGLILSNNQFANSGIDINNYLTIEALEDGLTVKLSQNDCEYCVDGDGVWISLSAGTATQSINQGQILCFRGNLVPNRGIGTFTISKTCNLSGNCMSMLFGDNAESNFSLSGYNYAFYYLFNNCNTIIEVSKYFLPATILSNTCYGYMFYGCKLLTTAPELPSTTLAIGCYQGMFYNCTSLATATELPATTLASNCYYYMFSGCSSLTTAPELPATTLASGCYNGMFSGTSTLPDCSNIDFYDDSVVASGGLQGLFYGTKVTDNDLYNILPLNDDGKYYLPATTLTDGCYKFMFQGCTSLRTAPELPATNLVYSCYLNMFNGCTSLTIAPELPATTLADMCYSNMFQGCTSLIAAPDLPATTLTSYCYYYMFYNCSKLNRIQAMFTTTPGTSYTRSWLYGVASSGVFIKNAAATWDVTGANGIPEGWTVQTA